MSYFHPNDKILRFILQKRIDCTAVLWYTNKARNRNNDSISGCGAVGSALPWGGRGRLFKSGHSDQYVKKRLSAIVESSFLVE